MGSLSGVEKLKFWFETSIINDDEELDVEVEYEGTPYVPATYYQPAEGGEVYVLSVKDSKGKEMELTEEQELKIFHECQDRLQDDIEAEQDAYGDYKYEEYRDRYIFGE